MAHTLAEIAAALDLPWQGDGALSIAGLAEPADAAPDELAVAMSEAYAARLTDGRARAAILWQGADWRAMGLSGAILPPRPRYALAPLSAALDPGQGYGGGIHPSAVIDPTAVLGEGVSVGPLAVIGPRARIGAGSVIGPQVHVGADVQLGERALLHAQVSLGARVVIGARLIAQSGARVGADGFSFVTAARSSAERARATLGAGDTPDDASEADTNTPQPWARIHSLGGVTIGDDVELGANTCIDRGTIRDTRIGDGCKFDNLVQIGHNVVAGRHCLFCAQVGVAGSAVLGDGVVLGGKAGVSDNISVGDRAVLGGGSIVLSNVPAGRVMLGYPATKMTTHVESYKALRRLPRLLRDVAALKKAVSMRGGND